MKYPECEKALASQEQILLLNEFLEYTSNKGNELCKLIQYEGFANEHYSALRPKEIDELVYGFFGISKELLEKERCLILQEQNAEEQP